MKTIRNWITACTAAAVMIVLAGCVTTKLTYGPAVVNISAPSPDTLVLDRCYFSTESTKEYWFGTETHVTDNALNCHQITVDIPRE